MLTAKEAFEESLKNLEQVQTIDNLLNIEAKIKESVDRGFFVTQSDPMLPEMAEKVAIEIEEMGYNTTVGFSGCYNEEKKPLAHVIVNWRYAPSSQSRVNQPPSY